MGGLIRAFVMFSMAGLGWTMGRNVGEKLWSQVQEKYPGTVDSAKKAMADVFDALKKEPCCKEAEPAEKSADPATPEADKAESAPSAE